MRKILQKALSLILILCFGISALLYLFFDVAQFSDKKQAQHEIKSGEKLEVIQLSLEEFNHLNGTEELWHNGELYDIGSYTVKAGFVSVTVFHDCNEESLIHTIAETFEPNDKITSDKLVHITRHHIHPPADGKILTGRCFTNTFDTAIASLSYFYPPCLYSFQIFSILKPPPEAGPFI